MLFETWNLNYARSVVCVLLLIKVVICSSHGNEDKTMDMNVKGIKETDSHEIMSLNVGQKDARKQEQFRSEQISQNQIPLSTLRPKIFRSNSANKIKMSFRTISQQPEKHVLLKNVLKDSSDRQSSRSLRAKYHQYMTKMSRLHNKPREQVTFKALHNIFPGKRRKRNIPVSPTSSEEREIVSAVSQDVRVLGPGRDKAVYDVANKLPNKSVGGISERKSLVGELLPIEWTQEGNYSAVWKIWRQYSEEKAIAREAQIAFMCTVFLLCLLSWAVWCSGMCNRKKIHYQEWNFQESHATMSMAEILKRRWKYLPEESFYEEVFVHDRGTDP